MGAGVVAAVALHDGEARHQLRPEVLLQAGVAGGGGGNAVNRLRPATKSNIADEIYLSG